MNKRRRVAALIVAILTIMTLVACKTEEIKENVTKDISNTEIQISVTPTGISTATPTQMVTVAPTKAVEDSTAGQLQEIRDIPSTELVKEIKIGWNLGNTMDATGGGRSRF